MWAPTKGTIVRAALFVFPDKHLTQFPIDFRLSICVWHTAKNLFVPRKKSFQLFVLSKSKLENQNRCLDFKLKFLRKICQIWICCHKLPLAGILCCPWIEIFLHGVTALVQCSAVHMLIDAHTQDVGSAPSNTLRFSDSSLSDWQNVIEQWGSDLYQLISCRSSRAESLYSKNTFSICVILHARMNSLSKHVWVLFASEHWSVCSNKTFPMVSFLFGNL